MDAGFDVTLERARTRDAGLLGSEAGVEARYRRRYIPGQRIYLERCAPRESADLVVRNDDPADPAVATPADPPGTGGAG